MQVKAFPIAIALLAGAIVFLLSQAHTQSYSGSPNFEHGS
jgi:hypothetical protein